MTALTSMGRPWAVYYCGLEEALFQSSLGKSYHYSCTMSLTDFTDFSLTDFTDFSAEKPATSAEIERVLFCFAEFQFSFTTPDALTEV